MLLTTEELGDFPDVSASRIEQILDQDSFGKFAILNKDAESFVQAGCNWSPSEECKAFLQRYQSDPWVLEYRDGPSSRQFSAVGDVTLEQVKHVFLKYLYGEREWQAGFLWEELKR